MTQEEVKQAEELELMEEESNYLGYRTTLADLKCNILYIFTNNTLTRTKYWFIAEHSNENDYISDYNKIQKLLKNKYGEPEEDQEYWKNNLYKDDYDQWGLAISIGHLVYYCEWDSPETIVQHGLYGENYSISHAIEYKGKEYIDFEKKEKEKETLDKL